MREHLPVLGYVGLGLFVLLFIADRFTPNPLGEPLAGILLVVATITLSIGLSASLIDPWTRPRRPRPPRNR